MGNGASGNKKGRNQSSIPNLPSITEAQERNPNRSPTLSQHSQDLAELDVVNPYNDNIRYIPNSKLDNTSIDRVSVPSRNSPNLNPDLVTRVQSAANRSNIRSNSRASTVLLPSASKISLQRNSSIVPENTTGRCRYCSHCKQIGEGSSSNTEFKWFGIQPNNEHLTIDMVDYDEIAARHRIYPKTGRLPGEYDYQPQLTIESIDEKTKGYYTQTCVVNSKPNITLRYTPFPNYAVLQRREYQPNKI